MIEACVLLLKWLAQMLKYKDLLLHMCITTRDREGKKLRKLQRERERESEGAI